VLPGPVGKPLNMMGFEKMIQAADDLPLKITHWLVVGWLIKKILVAVLIFMQSISL